MKKARLVQGDLPEDIYQEFLKCQELALDCEMMGLNPFRDRLCVVQIAAENGSCALIQVDEKTEYSNLKSILENSDINKIFHYARMDCLFLKMRLNLSVNNICCTKIMSKLVRTYTEKHGLKELVRELAGEQMDKANQTSYWGRENLTDNQLFYAQNDVKYLFKLKHELAIMLERENRLHLANEAFKFLPLRVELDSMGYGDIFEH